MLEPIRVWRRPNNARNNSVGSGMVWSAVENMRGLPTRNRCDSRSPGGGGGGGAARDLHAPAGSGRGGAGGTALDPRSSPQEGMAGPPPSVSLSAGRGAKRRRSKGPAKKKRRLSEPPGTAAAEAAPSAPPRAMTTPYIQDSSTKEEVDYALACFLERLRRDGIAGDASAAGDGDGVALRWTCPPRPPSVPAPRIPHPLSGRR